MQLLPHLKRPALPSVPFRTGALSPATLGGIQTATIPRLPAFLLLQRPASGCSLMSRALGSVLVPSLRTSPASRVLSALSARPLSRSVPGTTVNCPCCLRTAAGTAPRARRSRRTHKGPDTRKHSHTWKHGGTDEHRDSHTLRDMETQRTRRRGAPVMRRDAGTHNRDAGTHIGVLPSVAGVRLADGGRAWALCAGGFGRVVACGLLFCLFVSCTSLLSVAGR